MSSILLNKILPYLNSSRAFEENPYLLPAMLTAAAVCLFSFVMWMIFNDDKKAKKDREGVPDDESEGEYFRKLLEQQSRNDFLEGKTDKYEWRQNDREIDMSIDVESTLKSKDITVVFKTNSLKLNVKGTNVLDGVTFAEIIPDECNWQFGDSEGKDTKKLEINIMKKYPTKSNGHWRCVLKGDEEVDTQKLGPQVHAVDANDPNAVKDAIKAMNLK